MAKNDPKIIDEQTKLMMPIQDEEHLQLWLQRFLGFTLPDCKVTNHATATPLSFVYRVYRAIMDGKPLNIMALAGRDSAKTVSLSVIDLLSLLHDQRAAIHLGMTKKQATRARAYMEKYVRKSDLIRPTIVKENSTEIILSVGGQEVGLELLPCTPTAVQGGHAALVSWDELASTVAPNIVKGYRDSAGIPGASNKGKPAVTVKITSRQAGYSLAEEEIKKSLSGSSNVEVVVWSTIDCMEACPPSRSGTVPTPMMINMSKGIKHTPAEYEELRPDDQEGFELATDMMDKCAKCPLAIYCQGKARFQTSTSPILRKIDDIIAKINNAGTHEWALSQIMSLQPSSEGLVYFEFNPSIHVPGWNRMWQQLTGEKPGVVISREMFVNQLKKQRATFIAGVDWGWSNPSTCVVIAIDRKDNVYILDSIGATMKSDPEWVQIIKQVIATKYPIDMFLPDAENMSGIKIFKDNDLPVSQIDKGPGSVKAGINVVKRFIRVPGTNSETKLFVAPDIQSSITDVPGLIEEFSMYHKEMDVTGRILDDKNPAKEHDHYMDAIRYALFWYFGKATAKVLWPDAPNQGIISPEPSMTQIATAQGIQFIDNREDFDSSGNKLTNDDDDDPDGSGPGGGGLKIAWT